MCGVLGLMLCVCFKYVFEVCVKFSCEGTYYIYVLHQYNNNSFFQCFCQQFGYLFFIYFNFCMSETSVQLFIFLFIVLVSMTVFSFIKRVEVDDNQFFFNYDWQVCIRFVQAKLSFSQSLNFIANLKSNVELNVLNY